MLFRVLIIFLSLIFIFFLTRNMIIKSLIENTLNSSTNKGFSLEQSNLTLKNFQLTLILKI